MSENIIEIKDVCLDFGKRKILDHVDLGFKKGEAVLIAGNNGAGKSSLLRILAGVLFPDRGEVRLSDSIQKNKIAFLSDSLSFFQDFTLAEGIDFHTRVFGVESFDHSLLDELNLDRNQVVKNLSKGERAIYHLSLLLSQKPEVLLLDEIIHAIDPYLRELFLDTLIDLIDELNTTVIMVNHTFSEMGQLPERVIIMEDGHFIFDEPSEMLQQKIKKITIDAEEEKTLGKNIETTLPVIFKNRSSLVREYFIYPFKEEFLERTDVRFGDIDLSEIIKSFIGGYYAKKRD